VLPPTAVLRRGFGSGLERMYVFLALLQQLELQGQGCLIGPPDAGNVGSRLGYPISYPHLAQVKVPRGPFWAVGVRVGDDVRLFDPWRGKPFPVTLKQLKANADAAKGWSEAKDNVSGATANDAKAATAFLAVPVNSLSLRMAKFEEKLGRELGVKLAYDLKALEAMRGGFPDPKPAFWNPPQDPSAYGRASRTYLPIELGGSDRGAPGSRLYDQALRGQIPQTAFEVPERLKGGDRLRFAAGTALGLSFVEPPNPREAIQRGRFQDASTDLVAKQEQFSKGLERLRTQDAATQEQQIREWIDAANQAYDDMTRAQLNNDKEQERRAQAQLEEVWKQPPARWLIDMASAEVGRAEAALLLALCKHEQAERYQVRLERAAGAEADRLRPDARDAWRTALSAWRTYEQLSSAHAGFPGRAAHAQALSARAAALAAEEPKKPEEKKKEEAPKPPELPKK
jgi:hypothetical protein